MQITGWIGSLLEKWEGARAGTGGLSESSKKAWIIVSCTKQNKKRMDSEQTFLWMHWPVLFCVCVRVTMHLHVCVAWLGQAFGKKQGGETESGERGAPCMVFWHAALLTRSKWGQGDHIALLATLTTHHFFSVCLSVFEPVAWMMETQLGAHCVCPVNISLTLLHQNWRPFPLTRASLLCGFTCSANTITGYLENDTFNAASLVLRQRQVLSVWSACCWFLRRWIRKRHFEGQQHLSVAKTGLCSSQRLLASNLTPLPSSSDIGSRSDPLLQQIVGFVWFVCRNRGHGMSHRHNTQALIVISEISGFADCRKNVACSNLWWSGVSQLAQLCQFFPTLIT